MNRKRQRELGKSALEIIEEAVHLLRMSPLSTLVCYYIGSVPFVLGLLYFWADMSRSAFAYEQCAEMSLALALLFLWLKCWQAVFARRLLAHVSGEPLPRWTLKRIVRLGVAQTVVQSTAVFALPIALVLALPFGWVYALYHSASPLGDGESGDVRAVVKRSWYQATLWPFQNHIAILILFGFGAFVFMNVTIALFALPYLLRILLGVETVFTRSGARYVFNTTFLTASLGITYLCVNPLVKAVYVLRCFYGESIRTGADLKAALRGVLSRRQAAALALIVGIGVLCTGAADAATPSDTVRAPTSARQPREPSVSSVDLDRSISEVLEQHEYAWRLPRELPEQSTEYGWLEKFIEEVRRVLAKTIKAIARWIGKFLDWLGRAFGGPYPDRADRGRPGWIMSVRGLIIVLLVLVGGTLAVLFWRVWRQRKQGVDVVGEAVSGAPDLTDHSVTADQLPEDGWMSMARELIDQREYRLAMRALFLATLAHLAQRELIAVARFKSDWDYERELRRRAHAYPDLMDAFAQNVGIFEPVWYGMHKVTHALVMSFTGNLDRIKASAEH